MDDEKRYLTLDDAEQAMIERSINADNSEDAKKYAEAATAFHDSRSNEIFNENKAENDRKRIVIEVVVGVGTFVAALVAPSLAQWIKGEYDLDYQNIEWEQSKTENVIPRHNIHRRPK